MAQGGGDIVIMKELRKPILRDTEPPSRHVFDVFDYMSDQNINRRLRDGYELLDDNDD